MVKKDTSDVKYWYLLLVGSMIAAVYGLSGGIQYVVVGSVVALVSVAAIRKINKLK